MALMQAERWVGVSSTLDEGDKEAFLFRRMTATEELGRLFRFDLELFSERDDIKFEDVLGQPMTVRLALPQDKTRYFNGHVAEFSRVGKQGGYIQYQATLRPWLWHLTRTADCRIFPDKAKAKKMKAPDIILEVFREHGFTDLENKLENDYKEWEHCVQYRETDFNFVMRLMEHEGIYFYFRHEENRHVLVLADAYGSHQPYEGYEKVPYFPPENTDRRNRDHLYAWKLTKATQPGVYAVKDFDFMLPRKNLEFKSGISREHEFSSLEIFDYSADLVEPADGEAGEKESNDSLAEAYEKFAKNRVEELHSKYEVAAGTGTARGMMAGALFELTGFERKDQNREYLIVSTVHEVESGDYGPEASPRARPVHGCRVTAIDAKQPFRLARITPKPIVQGPQTAVVVGKQGEEIWTDQYGRVKLQFHWDRYSQGDENSSCWVRVAQIWAGTEWGGIQIPRIGHEVVVEFLGGDPDRPIITGSVYNGANMPPYGLPDNCTQSGIKSRSSKGGGEDNYNEIRFEDKMGEEQVLIHAEKDMSTSVENDKSVSVGHDQSETIENDKTITVNGTHTETIKKDTKTEITEGNHEHTVVAGTSTCKANKDIKVTSETTLIHVEAATEIKLTVGASELLMKADGTIKLQGVDIAVEGVTINIHGVSVTSKADADHNTQGAMVISEGSATNTVKGGMVMLNP